MNLGTLSASVTLATGGFKAGVREVTGGLASIGRSAFMLNQSLELVQRLTGGLVGKIGELGKNMVETAAEFDMLKLSLETLTKGHGQEWFDKLNEWAIKMPMNTQGAIKAFQQMKAMGMDPTIDTMTTLSDTVSALGGNKDTLEGIARALGQMSTKGKVQLQEMYQLAERGVPVFELLAKYTNLTKEQIADIGKYGGEAKTVIEAIMYGLNQMYGGQSAKIQYKYTGLKEGFIGYWSEFQRQIMDSGPMKLLEEKMLGVMQKIDRAFASGDFSRYAREIGNTVEDIINWLYDMGESAWQNRDKVSKFFSEIAETARNAWPVIKDVASAIGSVVEAAGKLITAVPGGGTVATYGLIGAYLFGGQAGLVIAAITAAGILIDKADKATQSSLQNMKDKQDTDYGKFMIDKVGVMQDELWASTSFDSAGIYADMSKAVDEWKTKNKSALKEARADYDQWYQDLNGKDAWYKTMLISWIDGVEQMGQSIKDGTSLMVQSFDEALSSGESLGSELPQSFAAAVDSLGEASSSSEEMTDSIDKMISLVSEDKSLYQMGQDAMQAGSEFETVDNNAKGATSTLETLTSKVLGLANVMAESGSAFMAYAQGLAMVERADPLAGVDTRWMKEDVDPKRFTISSVGRKGRGGGGGGSKSDPSESALTSIINKLIEAKAKLEEIGLSEFDAGLKKIIADYDQLIEKNKKFFDSQPEMQGKIDELRRIQEEALAKKMLFEANQNLDDSLNEAKFNAAVAGMSEYQAALAQVNFEYEKLVQSNERLLGSKMDEGIRAKITAIRDTNLAAQQAALAKSIEDAINEQQFQNSILGMTDLERITAETTWQFEKMGANIAGVADKIAELNKLRLDGFNRQILDSIAKISDLKMAFHEATQAMAGELANALVDWMSTGKFDFKKLAAALIKQLQMVAAQKTASLLMEAAYQGVMILADYNNAAIHAEAAMAALKGAAIMGSFVVGSGLAGMAHSGITDIPDQGTWLLDKGERVVDSKTNQDLKQYITENKGKPNVNMTVNINGGDEQSVMKSLPALKDAVLQIVNSDISSNGQTRQSILSYTR
jgi:tape measure domain-containing protein